jgi:anti-sigma factor RsiW
MATRDDLMRLLDGELSAVEATRVRQSLSAEDKERLAAMEEVGGALRKHLGEKAEAAKLDTWSAIAGKLDERGGDVVRPKRWGRRIVGVGAAIAIAAAALFFFYPRAVVESGTQIESVDFGEESGMLFQLHDTQTTVIWQTTNEDVE